MLAQLKIVVLIKEAIKLSVFRHQQDVDVETGVLRILFIEAAS